MASLEETGKLWPYFRAGSKVLTLLFEPDLENRGFLNDVK